MKPVRVSLKPLLDKIRARLKLRNKNWLAIICGEPGSGKSYSAISLCQLITGKRPYIVFNGLEMMELIAKNDCLQSGDFIIFDEAGVGLSARDWYSVQNKLLGAILQTFRHRNLGVIFTTPSISFIDIQARKLFHNYLECVSINYENQEAITKIYEIQHNSRLDKTYYKFPVFHEPNGRPVQLVRIRVPKPDEKTCQWYENMKVQYTTDLNQRVYQNLLDLHQSKKGSQDPEKKRQSEEKMAGRIVEAPEKFINRYNSRQSLSISLIESEFQIGWRVAKRVQELARKRLSGTHDPHTDKTFI